MRKFLTVCLFVLCLGTASEAQNVGFIGRRFIVNADLSLSPAFTLPNFISNEGKYWHFNFLRFYCAFPILATLYSGSRGYSFSTHC